MYVIHLIILAIMGINPIRYVKTLEVLILHLHHVQVQERFL